MTDFIKAKLNLRVKSESLKEYKDCVEELLQSEITGSLEDFVQHGSVTRFEHALAVSYYSYIVCKLLRLDFCSAARGGLLHDLFLYDWHKSKIFSGMHSFTHPHTALENANKHFELNKVEKDVIVKHMWPLTIKLPRFKESYVVSFVDKYCAVMEVTKYFKMKMISYKIAAMDNIS